MSGLLEYSPKDKRLPTQEGVGVDNNQESYVPNEEQLQRAASLLDLVKVCEETNIDVTVMGGYGLDGLHGKLTRDHGDIDMLVADEHLEQIRKILDTLGYLQDPSEVDKFVYRKETVDPEFKIEFVGVSSLDQFTDRGAGYFIPGEPNATLNGQPFKAMTLRGQKEMVEIQNKRAKQKGWDVYSPAKRQNQSWLISILEQKGTI